MKLKKQIIGSGWWGAVFISLAMVSSCAGSEPRPDEAPESYRDSNEILIRNATEAPVEYWIQTIDKEEDKEGKILPSRSIDRYSSDVALGVTLESDGARLFFQLEPGRRYAFRNDHRGKLGLYVGAHTLEDAPDLAPYVPTPHTIVKTMLELAKLSEDDVLIDLGCGDGRIVIAAARDYGARGIGIDIDPELIEKAKRVAKASRVGHLVEFRVEDATRTSLTNATVVILFLTPGGNELIRPRLETELAPGTRVISHNYTIPGWMVMGVEALGDERERHDLYLYVIGEK